MRRTLLSVTLFASLLSVLGCGANTGTTYDSANAPPVTQDEVKAREDYEAEMKKQHKEMYGN